MSKLITALVIIILIAGGAWYYTQHKSSSEVKDATSAQSEAQVEAQVQETSLKQLLTSKQDKKCTFELTRNNSAGSGAGTFYISNGKSRGDIVATVNNTSLTTHMMADGTTSYVWTDDGTVAYKVSMEQVVTAANTSGAVDPNSNYKFNCENWTPDQSTFVLPANIQFKEFNLSAGANASMNAKAADICNALPEAAKAQCLAAIKK